MLRLGVRNRAIIYGSLLLLILFMLPYISWRLIQQEERKTLAVTENHFQVFLDTTSLALRTWSEKEMQVASTFSRNNELIRHFERLLELENDPAGLISHPSQQALRYQLENVLESMGYRGYFLISRSGINLASSRNSNIGTASLLLKSEKLLPKVMAGQQVLSIPDRSDVPLLNSNGELQEGMATIFVLAPVFNRERQIIGAFALRIDPHSSFANLLSSVRLAKSGETYAINQQGLLLNESRFVDELHARGLLPADVQQSELNVVVREPDTGLLTRPARDIQAQQSGLSLEPYPSYRGVSVVGAWRWLDGLGLGLVSEISAAEAYADLWRFRNTVFIVTAFIGLMSLLILILSVRSRKRLEDSEAWQRAILNNMIDGVITIDRKGIVQSFSAVAEELFGYTASEVIGCNVSMLMPVDVAARHDGFLQHYAKTGEAQVIGKGREIKASRKDGTEFPADLSVGELWTQGDRFYVGTMRDITERKVMRHELSQQKKLLDMLHYSLTSFVVNRDFRAVTKEMLDSLLELTGCEYGFIGEVFHDNKGNPYLAVHAINNIAWDEATEKHYRKSIKNGLEFHDLNTLFGQVMTSGKTVVSNDPARDSVAGDLPRGNTVLNSFLGVPIFYGSKLVGMYGIANLPGGFDEEIQKFLRPFDTSYGVMIYSHRMIEKDIKTQAELIEAKDTAVTASREKSSFLATMSHEIRTPMNGVLGMINLLKQTSLNGEQQRLVAIVRESATSLMQIINDLLDFSRVEVGEMTLEKIDVNVPRLVENVAEVLFAEIHSKRLRLYCLVEPDVPTLFTGDPVRLRQILMNLVGNAIKFTQTEEDRVGEIQVCAAIDRKADGDWLRLEVIDNGIGMRPDQLDQLFHPFSQADSSTHRRFGGSGLGLSICAHLTKLMGGTIGCDSKFGEGSRFWVQLPVQSASGQSSEVQQNVLSGLDLLLLSDNPLVSNYLQRDWSQRGAEVRVCETLEQALERGSEETMPQVVILDGNWDDQEEKAIRERFHTHPGFSQSHFVVLLNDHEHMKILSYHDRVMLDGNPLRPEQLRHAIAIACGRAEPDVGHSSGQEPHAVSLPTLEEAEAAGILILVAEDNIVNQKVIKLQLNAVGYVADIVADGRTALKLMQTRNYGMVLTDCNMPEMDGFQLTAAIRENEAGTEKKIPILAITANVLQGEAERCIAAGMDGYIAKPVKLKMLKKTLHRWLPLEQKAASDVSRGAAIDQGVLASILGSDESIQLQFLQHFLPLSDPLIADIHAAFEADDLGALQAQSHKLKSSASSVGAVALSELCQLLEQAAKAGSRKDLQRLMPRLWMEWERVREYILGRRKYKPGVSERRRR